MRTVSQGLFRVTLYPFSDGTPEHYIFQSEEEAEAFCDWVRGRDDADYLAGGKSLNLYWYAMAPGSLEEAKESVIGYCGESEE